MRSTLFLGAAAALALIATDPALCAQAAPPPPADTMQPAPGEPEDPANPNPAPMPDPSQPNPPVTEPLPPEMPMPAGEAQTMPPAPPTQPMVMNREAPVGPMATPPDAGATSATSGGTTSAMMQPQPATKEYPPCSKTLQDNCRNPGEGPRRVARRPR